MARIINFAAYKLPQNTNTNGKFIRWNIFDGIINKSLHDVAIFLYIFFFAKSHYICAFSLWQCFVEVHKSSSDCMFFIRKCRWFLLQSTLHNHFKYNSIRKSFGNRQNRVDWTNSFERNRNDFSNTTKCLPDKVVILIWMRMLRITASGEYFKRKFNVCKSLY